MKDKIDLGRIIDRGNFSFGGRKSDLGRAEFRCDFVIRSDCRDIKGLGSSSVTHMCVCLTYQSGSPACVVASPSGELAAGHSPFSGAYTCYRLGLDRWLADD